MSPTPPNDDKYARESFSWRRMQSWQLWSITAVAVILILWAIVALT